MSKVLLIIGDAAEVFDTLYPLYRVREEGYECVVAGPEAKTYHLVMHERPDDWDITRESPGYHLEADIAFRDIRPRDYIGMIISGGRAPEYIRYDQDLLKAVKHFVAEGLPVGSVCHGAEVLAAADVVRGRRIATVAKCRFDVEVCGGVFADEPLVVSDNIVTARTWADNAEWMRELIKRLNQAHAAAESGSDARRSQARP